MNRAVAVRDAATVILLRDPEGDPKVLMGKRGARAAFMPDKYVFPGGAVDSVDALVPLAEPVAPVCAARLEEASRAPAAATLAAAAIRELWEETGQILGVRGRWPSSAPRGWEGFAATGHVPSPAGLGFVLRAVTPAGRPRRFDARFFLADARRLATDPDDFSLGADELSDLAWIPLSQVRGFDLPFITQVALAEVMQRLPDLSPPPRVPFFRNDDEENLIAVLGGESPLPA
ncbi:NUDIX hydrolase [Roseitranquillus sediminis]|uniref:NUDIX hydrolase n=1 Tax=Roseitranquillus sediminis TaxID=2809051 RepID=UPI001D0C6851|nr:NUDIX hydrolase [Roseitranquillus sediminis]